VGGYGARRVAEIMIPTAAERLTMRRARLADAALFFEWRNEPDVRAMSFSQEPLIWDSHSRWFESRIEDPTVRMYVFEGDGLPVGQVRIEIEKGEGVLAYSLDRIVRGRGWSTRMISAALARLPRDVMSITARVKAGNEASRRVFARLGWTESRSASGDAAFRSGALGSGR
jgi:UDP-2,4-diacetamido-2,4,6-trideoxy-beta-L-altropyranose hydrolase